MYKNNVGIKGRPYGCEVTWRETSKGRLFTSQRLHTDIVFIHLYTTHMHVRMSLQISLSDTSLDSCCYHSHPSVAVLWVPPSQDGGSQCTQNMAALVFVRAPCVQDKGMDGSKSHMAYQWVFLQSMDIAHFMQSFFFFERKRCMKSDEVKMASIERYFLPFALCCNLLSKICCLFYARRCAPSQAWRGSRVEQSAE
jgi:hypothetical protein